MIRNIILLYILLLSVTAMSAQEYNFGVRAGQNYSTLRGENETGEDKGFSGGFHFGINFYYNFTDNFSLRTELMYIQNGFSQEYNGESHYLIRKFNGGLVVEKGDTEFQLDNSNGYFGIPITGHYRLNRRWEVFGGGYLNFLISPTGAGTISFTSIDNPDEIFFRQSLDYQYYGDEAGEIIATGTRPLLIRVEGDIEQIPKVVGAYYQYLEKNGNAFKSIDIGLSAGVSYYLNRGFYISLKADYGFLDVTNNRMDRSFTEINVDNSFKLRDDKDTHLGINVSFGFKF